MTMQLQLSDDEVAALSNLLDGTIADLSTEIADTDNAAYRAMLRDHRDVLRTIRGRLNGVARV